MLGTALKSLLGRIPSRRGIATALLLSATFVLSTRHASGGTPDEAVGTQSQEATPTDKGPNVEAARAHFFRGVKYYEGGDFRWALLEFQRAFDLSGNYRVLYNLARVSEELNTYAEATRAFEEYLRLGGDDIDPRRREEVLRELETLRPKLAHVTITVSPNGASVIVDNRPVGKGPLRDPIVVDAGEHFITVRHPGYVQAEKSIVVAAGDKLQETLSLRRTPPPQRAMAGVAQPSRPEVGREASKAVPVEPRDEGLSFAATATWVGTGVLAAGAAVTGGLAVMRAKDLADLRNSATSTQEERDAVQRKARLFALTSDVLTGAAVLAGATALYFTFGPSSAGPEQEGQTRVGLRGPSVVVTYTY